MLLFKARSPTASMESTARTRAQISLQSEARLPLVTAQFTKEASKGALNCSRLAKRLKVKTPRMLRSPRTARASLLLHL